MRVVGHSSFINRLPRGCIWRKWRVYVAFLVQPELSDKFRMKRSKSMRHKWFHCRLEPISYLRFGWLVPTTNRAGFSVCATRARCYCTTRPYAFARPRTRFALGMNKLEANIIAVSQASYQQSHLPSGA
jgi:hypothetical protein